MFYAVVLRVPPKDMLFHTFPQPFANRLLPHIDSQPGHMCMRGRFDPSEDHVFVPVLRRFPASAETSLQPCPDAPAYNTGLQSCRIQWTIFPNHPMFRGYGAVFLWS